MVDVSDSEPWYRYFWPWFLIALLGSSVLGGVVTVILAFGGRDSLVRDDWYRDGTFINRRLAREERARTLGVGAELRIDGAGGGVSLDLAARTDLAPIRRLRLDLSHATRSERDRSVRPELSDDGHFTGRVQGDLRGSWYAALAPEGAEEGSPEDWRLSRKLVLPSPDPIRFGAAR